MIRLVTFNATSAVPSRLVPDGICIWTMKSALSLEDMKFILINGALATLHGKNDCCNHDDFEGMGECIGHDIPI